MSLFILFLISQATDTNIITYYGKKIIYFPKEEKVILLHSAWVRYRDYAIFSDTIVYDLKKTILSAYKGVNFQSATESIFGSEFHFNLKTKRGMMREAKTKTANGYLKGENIYLLKEKTLLAEDCYYTTCDHPNPHYQFYGRRLKILLDDMAITEPILLKIRKFPLAFAPFWFFPIAEKRKSGLLPFKVGQSSLEGYYARGIGYYLVLNDYSDLTFYLDVMQKKGLRPKIEGVYLVRPFAEGNFGLTYIDEWDTKKRRYSANAKHSSVFFFDSDLTYYIDYTSDAKYFPDYAEEKVEWLKQEITNEASLSRRLKKFGKVGFNFKYYHDFPKNATNLLFPAFNFSLYQRPIFKNFGISPSFSASREKFLDRDTTGKDSLRESEDRTSFNLGFYLPPFSFATVNFTNTFAGGRRKREVFLPERREEKIQYLSTNNGLSLSHRLSEGVYLSENFSYSHRLNFAADSVVPDVGYHFSLSSGLNLYRPYYLSFLTLKGFLHQISPSFSYSYQPRIKTKGIWGIPRFDTLPLNHQIGINIGNNIQGKFGEEEMISNIGNINFGLSYNLNEKKLTPLSVSADFILLNQPNGFSQTFFSFHLPLDSLKPKDFSITTSFSYQFPQFPFLPYDTIEKRDVLTLSINHLYSGRENHMLLYTIGFAPRGWNFTLTSGYNIARKERADYSLNLWRDLHCWELLANFSGFGTNWRYDFRLRIKKLPDVAIGKGILDFLLP
ncbi:MAG: putative LPS assembly protein LptD [candidate division WOR-3 bacterium]